MYAFIRKQLNTSNEYGQTMDLGWGSVNELITSVGWNHLICRPRKCSQFEDGPRKRRQKVFSYLNKNSTELLSTRVRNFGHTDGLTSPLLCAMLHSCPWDVPIMRMNTITYLQYMAFAWYSFSKLTGLQSIKTSSLLSTIFTDHTINALGNFFHLKKCKFSVD
jgi:hypothetical protein